MKISASIFALVMFIDFANAQEIRISHNDVGYFINTTSFELKSNLPNGLYRVYLDASKSILEYSGEINNQKRVGTWTWFFENGIKKNEIEYANGLINSSTAYFPSGSKSITRSYSQDALNGPFTRWYQGGSVNITGSYSAGKPAGVWKYYRLDGSLIKEEQF